MNNFVNLSYLEAAKSPEKIKEWRYILDTKGYLRLKNFINPEGLAELKKIVKEARENQTDKTNSISLKKNELDGTILADFAHSDLLLNLSNEILSTKKRPGLPIPKEEVYPVLRILEKASGQKNTYKYHYDHTFLTIAVPIIIPEPPKKTGPLIIYPNARTFNTWKIYRRLSALFIITSFIRDKIFKRKRHEVIYNPGDIYLFYGYRSYHSTGELDPNELRAIALINLGSVQRNIHTARVVVN